MKRLTIICFMILIFVLCISATYASENDTNISYWAHGYTYSTKFYCPLSSLYFNQ